MAAINQAAGGCQCGCLVTFTVWGCADKPAAAVTVTFKRSGTTIAVGTTDATGQVTLDVGGTTGGQLTYSGTRWATRTDTIGTMTCGGTFNTTKASQGHVNLSPASNYHCTTCCGTPFGDPLHVSTPEYGLITLPWVPAQGSWYLDHPGGGGGFLYIDTNCRLNVITSICSTGAVPPDTTACPPSLMLTYNNPCGHGAWLASE